MGMKSTLDAAVSVGNKVLNEFGAKFEATKKKD